jgi:hypothetical protein
MPASRANSHEGKYGIVAFGVDSDLENGLRAMKNYQVERRKANKQ